MVAVYSCIDDGHGDTGSSVAGILPDEVDAVGRLDIVHQNFESTVELDEDYAGK